MTAWESFVPTERDQLIGEGVRGVYDQTKHALSKIREQKGRAGTARFLFCGAPGAGKTTLANMLANWWADSEWNITTLDGVSVSMDIVVQIERDAQGSIFGKYRVLIINECDLVTQGAQNKLLGVLERLPEGYVVFGTSNLKPVTQGVLDLKDASKKKKAEEWLVPRYASRFVQKQIKSPTIQESASEVSKLTGVPLAVCEDAARKASGDNRQLLALISEYKTAYELVS